MKEPTKEQLKKFWEWCGLQVTHEFIGTTGLIMTICKKCGKGTNFKNDLCRAPKLDLNNLFQHAVPRLYQQTGEVVRIVFVCLKNYYCEILVTGGHLSDSKGYHDTPALALFWAIWEAVK